MAAKSHTSIRMSHEDRQLIAKAAEAQNKSRTQFVLDSARAAATDALLDRNLFVLSEAQFAEFELALEAAPTSSEVKATLSRRLKP